MPQITAQQPVILTRMIETVTVWEMLVITVLRRLILRRWVATISKCRTKNVFGVGGSSGLVAVLSI